jgi:hypothetical protein
MKTVALIMSFTAALAAQQPPSLLPPATRWYHGSLTVGSINKEVEVNERWGELDITNTGTHTRTVTMTVRRYSGRLITQADHTLAPGEKRSIRIEDPEMNVIAADGLAPPDVLHCAVLVEPLSPDITIAIRQMDLHGDKLRTTDIGRSSEGGSCCRERSITRLYLRTDYLRNDEKVKRLQLANLEGKPRRVIMCESVASQSCSGASTAITIPAYSTSFIPISETTLPYILFVKPESVIVGHYYPAQGTTSTFNVESGITFRTPVEKKK